MKVQQLLEILKDANPEIDIIIQLREPKIRQSPAGKLEFESGDTYANLHEVSHGPHHCSLAPDFSEVLE